MLLGYFRPLEKVVLSAWKLERDPLLSWYILIHFEFTVSVLDISYWQQIYAEWIAEVGMQSFKINSAAKTGCLAPLIDFNADLP